jgi:hypothetical protein
VSYSSDVLALSPDAYYRLGEASGTTLVDSSGNARDGTYTGTVTYGVTGIPGAAGNKAVTFPGTSGNHAQVNYASWMDHAHSLSVGCWFKTTNTGLNYMVQRWHSSTTTLLEWGIDLNTSNAVRAYVYSGGAQRVMSATVTGLRDGNWHMVVATWDDTSNVLTLYVDGVSVGTPLSTSGAIQALASGDLFIGRRGATATNYFNGTLDEVFVANALNSTQVAALYTSGSTPSTLGGTLGVTTETDAAQTLGRRKSKTLGIATETDAAQTIARIKRKAIGTATETDTAVHINRAGVFGVAAETDAAQPIGVRKVRALGTATETDAAQTFAHTKLRALGIATETDAAVHIVATMPIIRALGTALEADEAQTIVPDYYIGPVDGDLSSCGVTNISGWSDVDYDVPDPDEPPGITRTDRHQIHVSS